MAIHLRNWIYCKCKKFFCSGKRWGYKKVREKNLTSDRNLLSAKYFHKMLYHQTTTNQIKINELKIVLCYKYELTRPSKGIVNLANLRTIFGYLFEEIEFTENEKSSTQLSPCTTTMQKINISFIHSSFFCHLLICRHSINGSNCSKYCN